MLLLAADHVTMAVGQHRRLGRILDPAGDQERPIFGAWIGQHRALIAELLQRIGHLARDVLLERRHRVLLLAGGRDRHPALQVGEELALVEILFRAINRAFACTGHGA